MAEILRKQLALAVKKIQWSYAIFWAISSSQNGVLEWDDGYYNGDIKTRKTIQAEQLNVDQLGLQRTEQLRELYESLLDAENNRHSARPSAALSPEDLTDTEWYFLICMSFVFNSGQGLPGRSLAKNQTTWLCNANYADSKVFNRVLLAKVSEDPSIVQHIKSFLGTPGAIFESVADADLNPDTEWEKGNMCSSNGSLEEVEPNYQAKESLVAERLDDGTSQQKSWQLMDGEISNTFLDSGDSSDCISETFIAPEKTVPQQDKYNKVDENRLLELQGSKDMELTSVEILEDDINYQGIVSTLLKTSHQLIMGPCFKSSIKDSCFVRWKKGRSPCKYKSGGTSQRLLKKVLYEVPVKHNDGKIRKPESFESDTNHAPEERRQREKMQEKFMILRSIVPSTGKVDNVSLLDETIEYLRNLEKRVEGLESQKELVDVEARRGKRIFNVIESTSDNYGDMRVSYSKKQVLNKRKGSGTNAMNAINQLHQEDNKTDDVKVSKTGKGIVIEIECPWREELFVDIMGAINNLHLDSHSVQSSKIDGNLSLTINSKVHSNCQTFIYM
uniref:BHLH domain-containing protein n=1 Tax=Daucus carota subsp. sativus TaxID=79200 RepID=A0A166FMF6_DAUCS